MSAIKVPFGNLKRHYEVHKAEIDKAVFDVLESGWYLMGDELKSFEKEFAAYCGAAYGVGVASGTDAIEIALRACGIGHSDEVLTVSNTCVPTVAGILAVGARVRFVDIDPATYNMDPVALENRVGPESKAIVVVQLYGQCADMDPVLAVAKKYGLKVIEDCAQGAGAEYRGKKAGTFGDAAAFSFYPSKNLGAFGDAGMVITNDPVVFEKARMIRNYGQQARYEHVIRGVNSRMDEIQAAILRVKLPYLDNWNERRREIAGCYISALSGMDVVLPVEVDERRHVYHLFVILVKDRKSFMDKMSGFGVQTAIHYSTPVHRQPAYAKYRDQGEHLRITEGQAHQLVSLPIYPELTGSEVAHVAACAASALKV